MKIRVEMWPNPILSKQTERITDFSEENQAEIHKLVIGMLQALREASGVGLAAPQIGRSERLFVYHLEGDEGYMLNPKIIFYSPEKQTVQEGCLSFPGVNITVTRSKFITVEFQTASGEVVEMNCEGFKAQMIQHEIDHLDGKVFTRFLSRLKKDIVHRKMIKLSKKIQTLRKEYEQLEELKNPVDPSEGRDTGLYELSIRSEQV